MANNDDKSFLDSFNLNKGIGIKYSLWPSPQDLPLWSFLVCYSWASLNIWASSFHAACLTFFCPVWVLIKMNFFLFLLWTKMCCFGKMFILRNCELIVKELSGAWSWRQQKLPVGTEHAFLLPFLSAVFRSSAVSKVIFMEYEFISTMRIILFLLIWYSGSSWHWLWNSQL